MKYQVNKHVTAFKTRDNRWPRKICLPLIYGRRMWWHTKHI